MRISDWSSDVCSSDLRPVARPAGQRVRHAEMPGRRRRVLLGQSCEAADVLARDGRLRGARQGLHGTPPGRARAAEIGRASFRERVCQYVYISVVAVQLKKKKHLTLAQNIKSQ